MNNLKIFAFLLLILGLSLGAFEYLNDKIVSAQPISNFFQHSTNDIGTPNWINRSLGTTYVNNLSRAIFVYGSANIITGDNTLDKAYVECQTYDDLNSPIRMKSGQESAYNGLGYDFAFTENHFPFYCAVAPYQEYSINYYNSSAGQVTLEYWNEVAW